MTTEPELEGTIAWRELVAEATRRLDGVVAAPPSEARWIVEEASGFEGAAWSRGMDTLVTERGMARFDDMMTRRLAGEPIQYVLGSWGFRSLDLFVDSRVLIPRPETETVVEHALAVYDDLAERRGGRPLVVDLGTGSGAIALSFAVERPGTEVWATDVSEEALIVARGNLAGIGRRGTTVTICQGSWFEALPTRLAGEIDLIVTNPPYIGADEDLPPEVIEWEPSSALISGPNGLEALEQLLAEAPSWLADDGAVVAEMAPHQGDGLSALAAEHFREVSICVDLVGRDRALVARHPL